MVDEAKIKLTIDSESAEQELDTIERRRRRDDREDDREERAKAREERDKERKEKRDSGSPGGRFGLRPGQVAGLAVAGPAAAVSAIPIVGPPIANIASKVAPFIAENPEFLGVIQGIIDESIDAAVPAEFRDRIKAGVGGALGAVTSGTSKLRSIPATFEATKGLARTFAMESGGQAITSAQQQALVDSIGKFQRIAEFQEQMRITFEANSNRVLAKSMTGTIRDLMGLGTTKNKVTR